MGNTPFCAIRGTEASIAQERISDGHIYYAYDTGRIYLDKGDKRYSMGSGSANGASIYFGHFGKEIIANEETEKYHYPLEYLEDTGVTPNIDDVILDDWGALYRILVIENDECICSLLPLSGGGGGGGGWGVARPSIKLNDIANPVIINGQPFEISFLVKSALDENKTPLTNTLLVYWTLIDGDTKQSYYVGTPLQVNHNEESVLKLGSYLKDSTDTIIELYVEGLNHDEPSAKRQANVSTVEMYLEQTFDYNPANRYNTESAVLKCNAIGSLSKILEWTIDGQLVGSEVLSVTSTNPRSIKVPSNLSTHGYHSIEVNLYQNLGDANKPIKGLPAAPLKYEVAIVKEGDSTQKPIVWMGDYKNEYYNYDTIQIPFLVYDPSNTAEAEVRLYKNEVEIDGSPRTIKDFTTFSYWQIADAELNRQNYYSIACGKTPDTTATREVNFAVVQDPNRDMTITQTESLKLNFDPIGRSNSEPVVKRASWEYGEGDQKISATFDTFNWYNNGWFTDEETKNTFLRISNGAKFTIPFGKLAYGTSDTSKQSNTIEIAFKVRNVQNYSNLITNITRYKDDDNWYNDFKAQTLYTNYDAFLQATLNPDVYESLEFARVQKNIDLDNVVCGFYSRGDQSVTGVCVGSQDTFFSNGKDTVSVSYVENEMVYLSFVYNHELKLLLIYINGVITGVISSSVTGDAGFTINSDDIVFNSDICDIDLYKLRVYNTALTVNDIVTNHAVDKKSVTIYDQNGLALNNNSLKEYQFNFDKMLDYNKEHPEAPLMPYIVFDTSETTNDDKLPYAKSRGATPIKVEFVNVPLDTAYARGELVSKAVEDGLLSSSETDQNVINEAVRLYYKHHCPSWTSTLSASDTVNIEVQGTSSEFYPRRNFKIKTKYEKNNTWGEIEGDDGTITEGWTEEDCLNIFMHKGPYEETYKEDAKKIREDEHYYGVEESRMIDGWYMNNYTNPTDRWTMKVDYMESSGSYNAGFASLAREAYTKHPLEDYYNKGLLGNKDKLASEVFGTTRWEDYRTSLLGFPVMAFQKRRKGNQTEHLFIGYYRMLLDKGSDQVLGFKAPKKVTHKLLDDQKLRDVAECWEFSTNARTFCSYRDPWDRVEFSFKAPRDIGEAGFIKLASNQIGGPMVLNHFEPRYFKYEDYLKNDENGFYNFGDLNQEQVNEICEDLGIPVISTTDPEAPYLAQDAAVNLMKNWEKVCKWIYSTNLDNVKSQGTYQEIPVGEVIYEPNKYYILNEDQSGYVLASGSEFDATKTYYAKVERQEIYNAVSVTAEEYEPNKYYVLSESSYVLASDAFDATKTYYEKTEIPEGYNTVSVTIEKYKYVPKKFYIEVNGAYSYCEDPIDEFDSSKTYYEFISLPDEQIALIADLLIAPATTYTTGTTYYTYNSDAKVNRETGKTDAIAEVPDMTAEKFAEGTYYVASPVDYAGQVYKYDTKEYRTAKFVNELTQHFDPEYLATYFVMTEVFECYDSRGKNCMMASWGPHTAGGDYIWYPIFYDIDTQLGINNTGIPSFEFNVDATEAGNYSTSDSILWNNFYKFFKGSYILNKYKNLRGLASAGFSDLRNPPLQSVDYLEGWYTFNPETTKNIADRGQRPLIATNLDLYWKYITITNKNAISQGVAYIAGAGGDYTIDNAGTYFYALQGDRSQSRRQFLTNRLEYIDSWLNQNNYARGGDNRIRGRVSANSVTNDTISDRWVETATDPYWVGNVEFGTKKHDFDAEYWLTLKPVRSSYVTAGDDSANYPSQKFDGVNPIKFKLGDIENGIRKSENYPEQLVYIYGMNQMADFGDMNKLYWTEFYMEGQANHLTRLQLGYDGYSATDEGVQWYNKKLNGIKLSEMPLLKEANFSRIGLQTETTLDLTKSEKLENFRAVGTSKLIDVQFAEGVALNTLYLPESITSLKLIQANLLDNLITDPVAPTPTNNSDGTVTPPTPGLFLEGFFSDNYSSSITNIHLDGGNLGYGSYKILKKFFDEVETTSNQLNRITMTGVNWSPYVQLTEGAVYDPDETYYLDDKHYGLEVWEDNVIQFHNLVLNGRLYIKTGDPEVTIDDEFITMISDSENGEKTLRVTQLFADASSSAPSPILSGIVYVENEDEIEESKINQLQTYYPNLKFIFAKVRKAYSAEFLFMNPDTGIEEYVQFADGSKLPSVQKIRQDQFGANVWFTNPFSLYRPQRAHYDFVGWSTNPNADPYSSMGEIIKNVSEWQALHLVENQYDYVYYAIFAIHSYNVVFYDGNGQAFSSTWLDYGTVGIPEPGSVPSKDDSELALDRTYGFVGYTDNLMTNKIVDLSYETVRGQINYYAVFEEMSVYDNIQPRFFRNGGTWGRDTNKIILQLDKRVSGKITVPATWTDEFGVEYIVAAIDNTFASSTTLSNVSPNGDLLTHVFFEKGTQIQYFAQEAFRGFNRIFDSSLPENRLKFVEFPASLTTIGESAFFAADALDYEALNIDPSLRDVVDVSGSNISAIGSNCFQMAFKEGTSTENFKIGSAVKNIGQDAFTNIRIQVGAFTIGTASEPSLLSFDGTPPTIFQPSRNVVEPEVYFYSKYYNDSSDVAGAFKYCGTIHVM